MPKKESKQKSKKAEKKSHEFYNIEEQEVKRLRPNCERCGPGYFMADHGNRYTCGACGLTRYKQQS
ncbi:MAG: 30S ribosomal protein S27ae [Candidatus Bathyarchaeota archaeon]|nr:30S ribosomal protein S27ae [Candidatus Bathyarchaeum tardum]WGM88783.1 MAG: 30S ribosomal protein S27ae [Candidatus Bathyarchaeum tardum]WNZ28964.1 MAG: 30S ribosomal protein S27ae [Candidatus Bathyarchaeota archaeon]